MPEDPKSEPSLYTGLGQAMGLATEIVVATLLGAGLGWLLSRWIGYPVLFILIGTMLGGAAGINTAYKTWKRQT